MKTCVANALAAGLWCVLGVVLALHAPWQVALAASPAPATPAAATEEQPVLQANGMLVRAFERDDAVTIDHLLDPDFTWIDSAGIIRTKEEVLLGIPHDTTLQNSGPQNTTSHNTTGASTAPKNAAGTGAESASKAAPIKGPKPAAGIWSDAKVTAHVYGHGAPGSAAVILIARGKTHIVRVWVKRSTGWRLLHINEITQIAQAPAGDAAVPSEAGVVTPCINPCKSVPYTPPTPADQAAFSAWQSMETGSSVRDMDVWGAQVADDCLIVDSAGSEPLTKAERIAKTLQQKQAGVRTNEAVPLLQARMFDFGDTVMMISMHQPYGGKPYWATRLWTNANGRYLMFISFHTAIADVPSFALSSQLPDK